MILSIQIPTTDDRKEQDEALVMEITRQIQMMHPETEFVGFLSTKDGCDWDGYTVFVLGVATIEVIRCRDDKEISIGEKRDRMYKQAIAKYSWQIDSDDSISPDGIEMVMHALESKPDCVTFQERVLIDGKQYKSNHSAKYHDWEGDGRMVFDDGFHFHRTPFMKSVIRTDYCQHIGVADRRFGEDHEFAILIKPMLLNEVHIDKELYLYQHISSNFKERYGIKD